MDQVDFLPLEGSDRMFDVVLSGSAIGFVWRDAEVWHASVISMTDRSISATSRELAVDQLCKKWLEIVKGE